MSTLAATQSLGRTPAANGLNNAPRPQRTAPGQPSMALKRDVDGLNNSLTIRSHWQDWHAVGRQLEQHGVSAPGYRPLVSAMDELTKLVGAAPTHPSFVPVSKDSLAAAAQFGREGSDGARKDALSRMVNAVFNQPFGAPREVQDLAGRAQRATTPDAVRAVGAQLAEAINRYQPAAAPKSSGWLSGGRS